MQQFRRTSAVIAGFIVFASAPAGAQQVSPVHPGGWIIGGGGSIGRSHDDVSREDLTHIVVQPNGLVFVTKYLAIGGSVPLSYSSFTGGHTYAYGIGPSARLYFMSDTSRWLPFVGATVTPEWQKSHREVFANNVSTTLDADARFLGIDGSLGLTRLLAEHVGATGELYYTHTTLSGGLGLPSGGSRGGYDMGARFGLTVFVH
jgi:hypothetical protein